MKCLPNTDDVVVPVQVGYPHGLLPWVCLQQLLCPNKQTKLFVHHHPAASAGDGEDAVGVNER